MLTLYDAKNPDPPFRSRAVVANFLSRPPCNSRLCHIVMDQHGQKCRAPKNIWIEDWGRGKNLFPLSFPLLLLFAFLHIVPVSSGRNGLQELQLGKLFCFFFAPPPLFLRERRGGGGECLFSPSRMKGDQYYFSMQTHFIASKSSRPTN